MTNFSHDPAARSSAFEAIAHALTFAYELNADPRFEGQPCRSAFKCARETAQAAFGELPGLNIVDEATARGEYSASELREIFDAFYFEDLTEKAVLGLLDEAGAAGDRDMVNACRDIGRPTYRRMVVDALNNAKIASETHDRLFAG